MTKLGKTCSRKTYTKVVYETYMVARSVGTEAMEQKLKNAMEILRQENIALKTAMDNMFIEVEAFKKSVDPGVKDSRIHKVKPVEITDIMRPETYDGTDKGTFNGWPTTFATMRGHSQRRSHS